MKTSIKKAICAMAAALLMIVFSIAVTGCDKEPEEPKYEPPKNCDVVLETKYGGAETYENFIAICDSYDEIQKSLINHGAEPLNNDEVLEYAEKHVEDKVYVVCFYVRTSYNGPHRLREVEVTDGKLTMYIWRSKNTDASTVMGGCLFIAGVDKSFVANVTECEYVFV